jgi:two-component system, LytTR family, sensor kinase
MHLLARRWWLPYLTLLSTVWLLLSASALQAYRLGGGSHPWEPFLWEASSVIVIGVLALVLHRLVGRLRGHSGLYQMAVHALALPLFSLLHIGGMFGLRFAVYALVGMDYHADPLPTLLVFEGAKDAVSYLSILLMSHGVWAAQASREREQELDRTRRELAELQLARLADQVQPHFLFNTLNLIASVMHEDVEQADRLLCQLADLLRHSLAAQAQTEHTLDEELALIAPFLALMQARFGPERLVVQIDADAAARACRLPSLLLLAPVENAVKHDVALHPGPVTVRVAGRREGATLVLEVHNQRPAPSHPLTTATATANPASGLGMGLRNTRERLLARHGAQASVTLSSSAQGSCLQLRLPT